MTFAGAADPLINNVDVAIVLSDPAAIKDALVRQAASPVRWVETCRRSPRDGITHVVECGPGKVLAGLTKRIDGSLIGDAIVDQASLEAGICGQMLIGGCRPHERQGRQMNLENQVALVTGASRGIGQAIAHGAGATRARR